MPNSFEIPMCKSTYEYSGLDSILYGRYSYLDSHMFQRCYIHLDKWLMVYV